MRDSIREPGIALTWRGQAVVFGASRRGTRQLWQMMALARWFLAWTGAKLSAVLPISLGGLGVREATLVSVLAVYGAPADRVLAAGILWQGGIVVGSASGFLVTEMLRR
jgi:hypothetical protein